MQLPSSGVKNACESRQIGADKTWVPGQSFDGSGNRFEQRLVGKTLMVLTKNTGSVRAW